MTRLRRRLHAAYIVLAHGYSALPDRPGDGVPARRTNSMASDESRRSSVIGSDTESVNSVLIGTVQMDAAFEWYGEQWGTIPHFLLTVVLVASTATVAVFVKRLDEIIAFVGATSSTILGFIIPFAFLGLSYRQRRSEHQDDESSNNTPRGDRPSHLPHPSSHPNIRHYYAHHSSLQSSSASQTRRPWRGAFDWSNTTKRRLCFLVAGFCTTWMILQIAAIILYEKPMRRP
ncbi:hypothetical protein M427DRAFT_344061 [Gonapodya prolifera JEL478]|uniref:Amino acid transporter transmembrane domain-containing protein n=1 Tax=Gonapodya prolifera (strain JEL478) TaxID=1344416 RepID=A0A139AVI3_GONPJ|nr:hypothetical protein M427DRAFT_344061 [Gonapodya prolifera JEL478]|eukprot:KXS20746.1 hypothetical protein M427DRAFT_344061 [Gonapodya prolifera JEL478]